MTSAEFAAWIVRSLVLALAAVLAQRLGPTNRRVRTLLPLAAFAALLLLTAQDYFHGPQLPLALPSVLVSLAPPATESAPSDVSNIPVQWLAVTWLTGAAFLLIREAAGAWRLRTIIRASTPLTDSAWLDTFRECRALLAFPDPVELRLSTHLGPAATGLRRHIILLPPAALAWTADQRRFILLHELAHFRHGDLAARVFARAVCAIQWFNPFAWLLARRMDFDREAACDAAVATATATPAAYAETLLAFAESPVSAPLLLAPAFGARSHSTLEARILRLITPVTEHSVWRRRCATALALTSLTLATILCACTWQHPTPSTDEVRLRLTADPFPGEP